MAGWNKVVSEKVGFFMRPWRWALLSFELFLIVLIFVLPQVDLPDFTFHRGSAPVLAKSRLSSAPVLAVVTAPLQSPLPRHIGEIQSQPIRPAVPTAHFLLSLFCTLLC